MVDSPRSGHQGDTAATLHQRSSGAERQLEMTDPLRLPQVLVLPRTAQTAEIQATIEGFGFARGPETEDHDGDRSISWSYPGGLPRLHYRCDPALSLHTLDTATAPPALRGLLAALLGMLDSSDLREALASDDEQQQLFALGAIRQTEQLELRDAVRARCDRADESPIREEAAALAQRLSELETLQQQSIDGLRTLADRAVAVIAALADPDTAWQCQPSHEDCRALFVPQIADAVADAVASKSGLDLAVTAQPASPEVIFAAPAGLYRWSNAISNRAPIGYRTIAGWMKPGPIWISWTGTHPDGSTSLLDGLVLYDGRCLWLPHAARLIEPLLPTFPGFSDLHAGHNPDSSLEEDTAAMDRLQRAVSPIAEALVAAGVREGALAMLAPWYEGAFFDPELRARGDDLANMLVDVAIEEDVLDEEIDRTPLVAFLNALGALLERHGRFVDEMDEIDLLQALLAGLVDGAATSSSA
jgi:hypothetical protein